MLFKPVSGFLCQLLFLLVCSLLAEAGYAQSLGLEPPLKRQPANTKPTLTISSDASTSPQPLRIAVHSWSPYASRNQQYFGLLPRMVSEALTGSAWQPQYQFMHWSQALDKLAAGEVDAAIVWASNDMALDSFLISIPLAEQRALLYFRKDHPQTRELNQLSKLRMVWLPQYVYDHLTYRQLTHKSIAVVAVSNEHDGFTQLLNGQADVFLLPQDIAKLATSKLPKEKQAQLGFQLQKMPFPSAYLLTNPSMPDAQTFMEQFNSRLKKLKQTGNFNLTTLP